MSGGSKRKSFLFEDIPDLQSHNDKGLCGEDQDAEDPSEKVVRLDAAEDIAPARKGGKGSSGYAKGKGKSNRAPRPTSQSSQSSTQSQSTNDDIGEGSSKEHRSRTMSQSSCASMRSQSTASTASQEVDFNSNSVMSTPGSSRAPSPSRSATPGLSGIAKGLSLQTFDTEDDDTEDDVTDVMKELEEGVTEITDSNGDLIANTQAAPVVADLRSILGRDDAAPDPEEEVVEKLREYSDAELSEDDEADALEPGTKEKLMREMVALDVVPGKPRQMKCSNFDKVLSGLENNKSTTSWCVHLGGKLFSLDYNGKLPHAT